MFTECEEVGGISDEYADDCFPAEVCEHVAHAEVPFFSDHENWWCCEVCECASYGDVDE